MLSDVFAVIFILISLALLWTAVVAWSRIESPAVDLFALVAGVLGLGSLVISAGFAASNAVFVLGSTIAVAMLIPIPWILFSFGYIGKENIMSLPLVGALTAPVTLGLSATIAIFAGQILPWFTLFTRGESTGLAAVITTLIELTQWGGLLYAGAVVLTGTGLVLWSFQRYPHLDSTTGTVLCTFGTVPWVSVLFALQLQSISFSVFSGTVAVGFGTGALAALALVGPSSLFDRVPAAGNVGPTTVIEELDDAVVITDGEGQVIELNPVARELFGSRQKTAGTDVTDLLDRSLDDLRDRAPVEIETDSGQTLFDPTVSDLTDQHDHLLGYAVVLGDATETTIRKQRVEVLNRILRHNLRNDMTTMLGQLEVVRSQIDDSSLEDNLDTIDSTGHELVALSDEIRELEQLLSVDADSAQRIRIHSLVDQIFEDVESEHDVEFHYRGQDEIVLAATPNKLRVGLDHLITNAIQHNNSDTPEVEVHVTHRPEANYPVEISVLDNGPGIPEQEQKAMTTGEETPLAHSSGIGLWTVHWIARSLGGKLSFANREPRGTAVKLLLPMESTPR